MLSRPSSATSTSESPRVRVFADGCRGPAWSVVLSGTVLLCVSPAAAGFGPAWLVRRLRAGGPGAVAGQGRPTGQAQAPPAGQPASGEAIDIFHSHNSVISHY